MDLELDYSREASAQVNHAPVLDFHGREVDRDLLRSLEGCEERRALVGALVHCVWVDRDQVLDDLAAFFEADPNWMEDVYDLLASETLLWDWVRSLETNLLASFAHHARPDDFQDPTHVRFFVMIGEVIELRPEGLLSHDARHYADWLSSMMAPREH